ncbi:MAG: carbon monoxide dehydrogenase subunit G [Acetobacteraceae bacterium]
MDMTGERRIPAPRTTVWDALNDPAVLKASIPGCESLEKLSDTQMKATAAVKIGPISARFNGTVQLSDIDPPNGYTISGEGQGGVAGFAKGGAKVNLAEDGAATLLSYTVNAQVGGKIAQLGARLVDATAKQMADAFFDRFSKQVEARAPAPEPAAQPETARDRPLIPANLPEAQETIMPEAELVRPAITLWALIPREPMGLPIAFWIGSAVFLIGFLIALGSIL